MTLIGKKFNNWQILSIIRKPLKNPKYPTHTYRLAYCKCLKCGKTYKRHLNNIISGKSLGCNDCKHGKQKNGSKLRLYSIWYGTMQRCYNKKYPHYTGGDVFKDWHNFRNFYDYIKRVLGERPKGKMDLGLIVKERGYYPGNLEWFTRQETLARRKISTELNASRLAKKTGYSRERIRQMTHKTSNSKGNQCLKKFVLFKIKKDKTLSYIYKPEAIDFLIKKRKEYKEK